MLGHAAAESTNQGDLRGELKGQYPADRLPIRLPGIGLAGQCLETLDGLCGEKGHRKELAVCSWRIATQQDPTLCAAFIRVQRKQAG